MSTAYQIVLENNIKPIEQLDTKEIVQLEETIRTSIQAATRKIKTKCKSKINKFKPETRQIIKERNSLSKNRPVFK